MALPLKVRLGEPDIRFLHHYSMICADETNIAKYLFQPYKLTDDIDCLR